MNNQEQKNVPILRIYLFSGMVITTIAIILLSIVGIDDRENLLVRNFAILLILVGITPIELVLGWPLLLTQKLLEKIRRKSHQTLKRLGFSFVLSGLNIVLFTLLLEVVLMSPDLGTEMASNWMLSLLPIFSFVYLLFLERFSGVIEKQA